MFFEINIGAAMAGAVTAALNWWLAPREMRGQDAHSEAKVLFVGEEFIGKFEQWWAPRTWPKSSTERS